ncbi:hypothetical protein [Yoonia sp.]|uniref:hypothetical protein n=1 Tax=Yoonia sp. TaxID=2212373 RepID=UPI00358EFC27
MTVQEINRALENCISSKGNYAEMVHSLFELGCSDELIKVIVVGALGEDLKDRVDPIITMVRAYEDLSAPEQIDILYSIVNRQDGYTQNDVLKQRSSA